MSAPGRGDERRTFRVRCAGIIDCLRVHERALTDLELPHGSDRNSCLKTESLVTIELAFGFYNRSNHPSYIAPDRGGGRVRSWHQAPEIEDVVGGGDTNVEGGRTGDAAAA